MGQPITVSSQPGVSPDVMQFDLNRSLTGMQIERYAAGEEISGQRPPDELARRIFALGPVSSVTVYSSAVTVKAPSGEWSSLRAKVEDTIVNLFIYYREGVLPAPAVAATGGEGEEAPAP